MKINSTDFRKPLWRQTHDEYLKEQLKDKLIEHDDTLTNTATTDWKSAI